MPEPERILEDTLQRAREHLGNPIVAEAEQLERVRYVARCQSNRAGVRLLMTCLLAKQHRPEVDVRKPYTEIGGEDSFSGRNDYDEEYIGPFVAKHDLPCNTTTAFLTPALRNIDRTLSPDWEIVGRPRRVYRDTVQLLDDVHEGQASPDDLLAETIRQLILLMQEQDERVRQLIEQIGADEEDDIPLSSEEIVGLIEQHLNSPRSSRLPVLVVTAAYEAAEKHLGERVEALHAHNAADKQTGALGDMEITLVGDDEVVTSYEMKAKEVTKADVDLAMEKIRDTGKRVDNYLFITTEPFDAEVEEYAESLYRSTNGGVEFAILDCIGFVRHFLHLFHRLRSDFLEAYQRLVLEEPSSAVNQPLKEVFLNLRRVLEADDADEEKRGKQ